MILLFLTVIPSLLWDEGPRSAPVLEKAGIHAIVTTGDAGAWAGTKVQATSVDASKLVKLESPGVDYQINRGGATGVPWITSNIWRMLKERGKRFLYEVSGSAVAVAVAEAYASDAPAYFRLKQDDLKTFASAVQFLDELDGGLPLAPRVNFGLVDDGSPEIEEVMNLLIRQNLLFEPVRGAASWNGTLVRIGTPEYPKQMATDPRDFAVMVRGRIGDANRLVRIYGSDTTLVRLYGNERHARLHLIQYGRNPVAGLRVRVLGQYPRVLVTAMGKRVTPAEDVVQDQGGTEFTIPEFRNYAVVDLDASAPQTLTSARAASDFALTADPYAPEWLTAAPVTIATGAFGEPLPFGATEIRSRWTRDSLYLLYVCPFRHLNLKPNPVTDRETPVLWDWDVAEAFIGGDFKNIGEYREYQVSPQGEWVDLDINVLNPKPDGGMSWDSGFEVKARIDQQARVWYGEMRIPLRSIVSKPLAAGDRLRLGLFRITGSGDERRLVAWQPSFRHNFHVPEAFGWLELKP